MATTVLKALTTKGTHGVGTLLSRQTKTLAYGGLLETADMDNYTICEITGYEEDGVPKVQPLSAKENEGFLVASPEQRVMGESLSQFYNAVGERVKAVIFEKRYTTIQTSLFTKNTGVTNITRGMVAHFDVTTQKYIVSAVGSEHADYAGSYNQFVVKVIEIDNAGDFDVDTISLVVTKA